MISGGKIAAIGDAKTAIPPAAKVIDAKGLDLWPGLIDAGTQLGLFEVGSLPETQDSSDSAEYQPELRTSIALHPDSELLPVARANGVLATFVQPTGGVISGQGCVINLDGWVPTEMTVLDKAGLIVNIPRYVSPNAEGARRPAGRDARRGRRRRRRNAQARKDRLEGDPRPVPKALGLRQGRHRRPRPQGRRPDARPPAGQPSCPTPRGRSR